MAEWLRLKSIPPGSLPDERRGILLDVVVSPYDLPDAVRGFKASNGRFRIEFRYIDGPEPSSDEQPLDAHVWAFEGIYSKRLLALEVDAERMGADAVGVAITTQAPLDERLRHDLDMAWNRVAAKHTSPDERHVLETARAALKTRESDLLTQLVASGA